MADGQLAEDRSATPQAEDLFVPTPDGVQLAATLYAPAPGTANGVALMINSSMATPRQYYRAFASHMAGRGFAVLTYDYRGIGGSVFDIPPPPARTAVAWGSIDQTAAADFLAERFPGCARMLLGHSLGGQILGLCRRAGEHALRADHGDDALPAHPGFLRRRTGPAHPPLQ
jgi:predicted alpha/beta hydrolase